VLQSWLDRVNSVIGRSVVLDTRAVAAHVSSVSVKRALPFTLAADLTETEFARFQEQFPADAPVVASRGSTRDYPHGTLAAHILGYVSSDRSRVCQCEPGKDAATGVPSHCRCGPPAARRRPDEFCACARSGPGAPRGVAPAAVRRDGLCCPDCVTQSPLDGVEFDTEADAEALRFLALDPGAQRKRLLRRHDGFRAVSGAERAFDEELRGVAGYELLVTKPDGYAHTVEARRDPEQGGSVRLSLDLAFQQAVENELSARFPENRASAVVLDVRTGEVLVCANSPSFHPGMMRSRKYVEDLYDRYDLLFNRANLSDADGRPVAKSGNPPKFDAGGRPVRLRENETGNGALLNHATFGDYPPGSSFKPVTAVAALRCDKPVRPVPRITPETVYHCGPWLDIGTGARAKRFPEHDHMAFGDVTLPRMLKVSSNVYCYQAGLDIGFDNLVAEARRFGLGERTTLEVPSAAGRVPDRRAGRGFTEGDIANAAIGQGDFSTTPLHLAAMIASFARGKTRTAVSLRHDPAHNADIFRAVVDTATGKPARDKESGVLPTREGGLTRDERNGAEVAIGEPLGLPPAYYKAVLDGLVACAHERGGTGLRVTRDLPSWLVVAAKTGTAQVKNNTANLAWTIGFAPARDPKIAFAVLVESRDYDTHFAGGANAGPVANFILRKWLETETPPAAAER